MTDFNSLKTESRNLKSANIDKMSALEIARLINEEDKTVAFAVTEALESIAQGIDAMADALKNGGRIFYVGAGTSGRLGVLDASECPPTYGVSRDTVIGIIAGGRDAAFESIEDAEDDFDSCVKQMKEKNFNTKDICVGLSASGSANCVKGALQYASSLSAKTISVSCNHNSPLIPLSDIAITVEVGPEVINGSTRMKAGTAQKLMLNMLSTAVMIRLGRVEGNRMVNMQLTNDKLVARGTRMVAEASGLDQTRARELLLRYGSVKKALEHVPESE